jgi:ATP-dependent RNA helicase HelY
VAELERRRLLPVIYFIFARQGCDQAVRRLVADDVRLTGEAERRALLDIADEAVAGLSADDLDALGYDEWREAFGRGLAAHHAGLLPVFKQAVEQAFEAGLVKAVFATETLALGVNMPARTVVLDKLVKYNGQSHADITPGEYTQLTGRAGRRGIDVEGHAVVAWQPGLDPRALAGLAARRTYPLRSAFNPTANMVVNLVASLGAGRARALLERSFAQFHADRSSGGGRRSRALVERFDKVCGVLAQLGYLTRGPFPADAGQAEAAEPGPAESAAGGAAPGEPDDLAVTDWGRRLARLYGEQDLVVAEALRAGVLTGLRPGPLAAVLSTLVYEARSRDRRPPPRWPDRSSDQAAAELRRLARAVAQRERAVGLEARPGLDAGFAAAACHWAEGASLGDVRELSGVTAGDFVRWIRQTVDLADQIADAARTGPMAGPCRQLAGLLRRGVVEVADPDE